MTNIQATFRYKEHESVLSFPCSDLEIDMLLQGIGGINLCNTIQLCTHIESDVQELSILEGKYIGIEELNYLAKRLDSFDKKEQDQFKAAMQVTRPRDLKDMINLSYNLHNYTLISDFSSLYKVGKAHRLNVEGAVFAERDESYDYIALGEHLLSSGKGNLTSYGVLFTNGLDLEEIYDGYVLPQFFYEDCTVYATISYKGKEETVYLPCEDTAICRAINRLGADSIMSCSLNEIDAPRFSIDSLYSIKPNFNSSDIYEINSLAAVITDFGDEDIKKLAAICDYAGVSDFENAALLARHLDSFEFLPDIISEKELGAYMIQRSGEFAYDDKLKDFYNYDAFGKEMTRLQNGSFSEKGYIGIKDDLSLNDVFREQNEFTMGGI